jgi:hypothetical protein
MARRRSWAGVGLVAATVLVAGCTARGAPPASGGPAATAEAPTSTIPATAVAPGERAGGVFTVNAAQAREVAAVVEFLRAFNAGRQGEALALFGDEPVVSDCDYRAARTAEFHGRAAVAGWLRRRAADHDRLTLAGISDENPEQPVGVVGVEYERRTSDTLRALGFAAGIVPRVATKVVFTAEGRIGRFVNGGGADLCRPR